MTLVFGLDSGYAMRPTQYEVIKCPAFLYLPMLKVYPCFLFLHSSMFYSLILGVTHITSHQLCSFGQLCFCAAQVQNISVNALYALVASSHHLIESNIEICLAVALLRDK